MSLPSQFSNRVRIALVLSVVWVLAGLLMAFVRAEQCNASGTHCFFNIARFGITFIALGVLPLVVIWGVLWVHSGRTKVASSAEMRHRLNQEQSTAMRPCKVCGCEKPTRWILFTENISYLVARRERTFSGFVCFPCMGKRFVEFELKTLLFTWWGIIGLFLGPAYLLANLTEYIKNAYGFIRDRKVKLS